MQLILAHQIAGEPAQIAPICSSDSKVICMAWPPSFICRFWFFFVDWKTTLSSHSPSDHTLDLWNKLRLVTKKKIFSHLLASLPCRPTEGKKEIPDHNFCASFSIRRLCVAVVICIVSAALFKKTPRMLVTCTEGTAVYDLVQTHCHI